MHESHPEFAAPSDEDARIWRYVDIWRLPSLPTSRSLFLSRADLLGDPLEGTISQGTLEGNKDPRSISSLPGFQNTMRRLRDLLRRNVAVSCWHLAEHESTAMWTQYAAKGSGVAIRTTYERLRDSLAAWEQKFYIGVVRYVDFETEVVGSANFLSPFVFKRREFSSEQELRVVFSQLPTLKNGRHFAVDYSASMPSGVFAPIDLKTLIECLVLAPGTPAWQADALRATIESLKLSVPVAASSLDRAAILAGC